MNPTRLINQDLFDRGDLVSSMSSTDGQGERDSALWTPLAGVWGVIGTKGYLQGAGSYAANVLPTDRVDVVVQASLTTLQTATITGLGLCARAVDVNNYYMFYLYNTSGSAKQWFLSKFVAGSEVTLAGPLTSPTPGTGLLGLSCVGNTISASFNGVPVAQVTDTAIRGSKHGLFGYGTPVNATVDDFRIYGDAAVAGLARRRGRR